MLNQEEGPLVLPAPQHTLMQSLGLRSESLPHGQGWRSHREGGAGRTGEMASACPPSAGCWGPAVYTQARPLG